MPKDKFHTAIVYVMENSKSVLVHFGGFEDCHEAYSFSDQLIEDLNIEKLNIPQDRTLY